MSQLNIKAIGEVVMTDAGSKIDNIQVGSKNLLLNSKFTNNMDKWTMVGGERITLDDGPLGAGVTPSGTNFKLSQPVTFALDEPQKLVFSLYYKTPSDLVLDVDGEPMLLESKGNTWQRKAIKFERTNFECELIIDNYVEGIQLSQLQLEIGTVMTDYAAAEDDLGETVAQQKSDIITLQDRTEPERMGQAIVISSTFQEIMRNQATIKDLTPLASKTEVEAQINETKEYLDYETLGIKSEVNRLDNELQRTNESIEAGFSNSGGVNMLRNSTGWFGSENWIVTNKFESVQNAQFDELVVGSGFVSGQGTVGLMEQTIKVKPSTTYTLNAFMRNGPDGGVRIKSNGNIVAILRAPTVSTKLEPYAMTFNTGMASEVVIEPYSPITEDMTLVGLMLNEGSHPYMWSCHGEEIANTSIKFNRGGLTILGADKKTYTRMSPTEFAGYSEVVDEQTGDASVERIFSLNGAVTEVNQLQAKRHIDLGTMRMTKLDTGVGFFKN